MNRYVVLGVTNYGHVSRLANRRGCAPNEVVEQAIEKSKNFAARFDQLILIAVGEDSGRVGDALSIYTYLIKEMPRPTWELVRI